MKQTLEEGALNIIPDKSTAGWKDCFSAYEREGFIKGAKWVQQQMVAREVEPPIVKKLLDETTPEQLDKVDKQMSEQTKCYCGHTTTCDCGPLQNSVEWLYEQLTSTWYDKSSSQELLAIAKQMYQDELKKIT